MKALARRLQQQWNGAHTALLANATSVVGTMAVTSGLGYLYWKVAARQFPPAAVGLGSATLSAMLLLANVSALGLGTLLVGELPRRPGQERSLITTALIVAGAAAAGLGLLFAAVAPLLSPDFAPLRQDAFSLVIFATGAVLTVVTLVLDQALIGLLRGDLQLARNAIFAAAKLVALLFAGSWMPAPERHGLLIYVTWLAGNAISLASLAGLVVPGQRGPGRFRAYRPQWSLLRQLGRAAIANHALNLVLQVPLLALPVLVTVLVSATTNAYFYMAWMLASCIYVIPVALTTAVYAVGARAPTELAPRLRFTLRLAAALGLLATLCLLPTAGPVLSFFGPEYATQAAWCLRVLGLGIFPIIVKDHYIATCRVFAREARAARLLAAGAGLELLLAAAGLQLGGLTGLGLGWVAALCLEAGVVARPVYQAAIEVTPAPPTAAPGCRQPSEAGRPPLAIAGAE